MMTFIRFTNIILVALLAGTSFGIWIGLNPAGYSPSTYIEQQQHLVRSLNDFMVFMVITATVVTLISAVNQRRNKPVFYLLLIAAFCLASCILISRTGNLPIQTAMLQWTPTTFPDDWTLLRDRWWDLHVWRTIVELIALALVSWTLVQQRGKGPFPKE